MKFADGNLSFLKHSCVKSKMRDRATEAITPIHFICISHQKTFSTDRFFLSAFASSAAIRTIHSSHCPFPTLSRYCHRRKKKLPWLKRSFACTHVAKAILTLSRLQRIPLPFCFVATKPFERRWKVNETKILRNIHFETLWRILRACRLYD